MGEDYGEADRPLRPEDRPFGTKAPSSEIIHDKYLTFEEASKCLNTLGKDETGSRYAYLKITATDMKLTDISIILKFRHVLFLDLSGNYLTTEALQVIAEMPFLIYLKAERNRVESVGLKTAHFLQVLSLNQNQIKNVENINQPLLDCLELNYNDIYTTDFQSSNLENLTQLELRSNLLFEISGFYPPQLQKLYIAANKISSINPNFAQLTNLEILHLRENNLQELDGFDATLSNLKYLNLRNNKIQSFNEFKKLQCLPKLETLIVLGNPLPGSAEKEREGEGGIDGEGGVVRDPVLLPILTLLPKLKRINKSVITLQDRIDAEDVGNELLDALLNEDEVQETDRTSTTMPSSDLKEESEAP